VARCRRNEDSIPSNSALSVRNAGELDAVRFTIHVPAEAGHNVAAEGICSYVRRVQPAGIYNLRREQGVSRAASSVELQRRNATGNLENFAVTTEGVSCQLAIVEGPAGGMKNGWPGYGHSYQHKPAASSVTP
jgi:hypothetical protein